MKRFLITAAAIALLSTTAHAGTYTYACRSSKDSGLHLFVFNTDKHTFTFRGKVYKNVKEEGETCEAKACFVSGRAVLTTATQGAASVSMLEGMDDDLEEYGCEQVRK